MERHADFTVFFTGNMVAMVNCHFGIGFGSRRICLNADAKLKPLEFLQLPMRDRAFFDMES
jgi:hypothetical protein